MISHRERKQIIAKIRLLEKITIDNGATENEAATAKDKIEVLRTKLKNEPIEDEPKDAWRKPPEQVPVDVEKAKKEHEAIMNAFKQFANKDYNKYSMDQHISYTQNWEDDIV